ncbi:MAG: MFS transporter [Burkholderiales bacterium]|jgi:MFS family permease|nr:MFS transporter [Burkholderiales bacterium]
MSLSLFKTRRFAPLFVTQFLGAFNDNLFKNALVVLLTFRAASWTTVKPELLTNIAAGLFILPFFLFSALAGQIADKFDKSRVARAVKVLEIFILVIAAIGFWAKSLWILLLALFLLGAQSALFGPVKYSILPTHLKPHELLGGNALIESGTFVAILLGTLLGGIIAALQHGEVWISLVGFTVAVLGYWASRAIPMAPSVEPQLQLRFNLWSETWRIVRLTRETRAVFWAIIGISWFWGYGVIFLAQFPVYAKNVLYGTESAVTLLLAVFSVGIGVGSLLCGKLSRGKLEIGWVPLAALGMTLFALDFALASPHTVNTGAQETLFELLAHGQTWRLMADLFLLSVCGGVYCVPLYTLMQEQSLECHRARIVAANNILNALSMAISAGLAALLLLLHVTLPALLAIAAIINAGMNILIFIFSPEYFDRAKNILLRKKT